MICKVFRRPDKLKPNALPNIDKDVFPPNVIKEYPKITPMPAIIPKEEEDPFKPVVKNQNTITVKQVNFVIQNSKNMFYSAFAKTKIKVLFIPSTNILKIPIMNIKLLDL